jgi:hypothetical protein
VGIDGSGPTSRGRVWRLFVVRTVRSHVQKSPELTPFESLTPFLRDSPEEERSVYARDADPQPDDAHGDEGNQGDVSARREGRRIGRDRENHGWLVSSEPSPSL